jgi:hypothetical protein
MSNMYYTTNPFAPLILINGKQMPFSNTSDYAIAPDGTKRSCVANPGRDYQEKSEQLTRQSRNANGQVVAQKINRRINKFDNLYWPILTRAQVNWLKTEIAKFECKLSYWDDENEAWLTRRYYWGDFEATPFEWETVKLTGTDFYFKRPTAYKDVKCNLIDMGY